MIAMQYGFILPADYDMGIIDRRIAERGHATDGFPGLVFKAYLSSRKAAAPHPAENRYAPFYLWESAAAMNEFLCGPGFAAVSQAFGRPVVQLWPTWYAQESPELASARFASHEVLPVHRHADLSELRAEETRLARESMDKAGALAAVAGFDPSAWRLVRFRLWRDAPEPGEHRAVFAVGHLSQGESQ